MQLLAVDEAAIAALVAACDVGGRANLEKAEFRQVMRSLGKLVPAGGNAEQQPAASTWLAAGGCKDRELDLNFASLDADKSGELDAIEVSRYLLSLKQAITRKTYEKDLTKVMGLRSAAQSFEKAAPLVVALQSGEDMKPPPRSPAARLGIFLREKGVAATDDVKAIFKDGDGNGKIIEVEFTEAMQGMGCDTVSTKELGALYLGFDSNNNGSLDLKELVACLKDLHAKAKEQLDAEAAVEEMSRNREAMCDHHMREGLRLAAAHFR